MTKLNEGLVDKFFEGIFKLLFKKQLKQAEAFINKVNNTMSEDEKQYLIDKLKKVETDSRTLRDKIN